MATRTTRRSDMDTSAGGEMKHRERRAVVAKDQGAGQCGRSQRGAAAAGSRRRSGTPGPTFFSAAPSFCDSRTAMSGGTAPRWVTEHEGLLLHIALAQA